MIISPGFGIKLSSLPAANSARVLSAFTATSKANFLSLPELLAYATPAVEYAGVTVCTCEIFRSLVISASLIEYLLRRATFCLSSCSSPVSSDVLYSGSSSFFSDSIFLLTIITFLSPAASTILLVYNRPPSPAINARPIVNAPTEIASAVKIVRPFDWRRLRPARLIISILLMLCSLYFHYT